MNRNLRSQMFEAYRRAHMGDSWEKAKPLGQKWIGLGTRSAYKEALDGGYMVFHDGKTPECMGWLVLTPKGVDLYCQLAPEFKEAVKQQPGLQKFVRGQLPTCRGRDELRK